MADIIFVTPTFEENISQESVGTLLLASILRDNGLNVKIFPFFRFGDPNDFEVFLSNTTEAICNEQPKIVSFYTRCDNYHIALAISKEIKHHCNAYIVFGGPQADITATHTLQEIPYVDFICCGEGENTIVPLFKSLLAKKPDLTTAGLVYRKGDEIVCNARPELIQDLDNLPHIDYSLSSVSSEEFLNEYFPIDVGRGCPFGCTYCSTKTFWGRKYRLKSPSRIAEEIKQLHEQFGITSFAFEHDMFTMNRKQVVETCRLLKALDFDIIWKCSARLDCLDYELIDTMVDAGMVRIFIGIESGSPRMQKLINKHLKLDGIVEKITYISNKNIQVVASFIYGFPDETDNDLSDTLALLAQLAKVENCIYTLNPCTFLPGTELYNTYADKLTYSETASTIAGSVAVEACSDLIKQHPKLFPQFQEYNTPQRSKLAYLKHFARIMHILYPVYQYILDDDPKMRFMDLYYDFISSNAHILANAPELSFTEIIQQIIAEHNIIAGKEEDPYYDILLDYHRITAVQLSHAIGCDNSTFAAYCFSPVEIQKRTPIQEIERKLTVAAYIRTKDGKLQLKILKQR